MNNKQSPAKRGQPMAETTNAIKMDLHRVCTYVGNLEHEVKEQSVLEFLDHALAEFEKMDLSEREEKLRNELVTLKSNLSNNIKDPHKRLRWAENAMTIRCRI